MKTAFIITGHSRGIGAALTQTCLSRGMPVLGIARAPNDALSDRYPLLLEQVALDLSDTTVLARWLDETDVLARFARDAQQVVLVNNAGTLQPMGAPGARQGSLAIARAVSLNVAAPLMLADAFVAAMARVPDRRVVHISSGAGRSPYPGWSIYGATKAALDLHARAVQRDAVAGLRVGSVAPGVVDTAMQAEIRATDVSRFPNRARFEALQRDGDLSEPAAVADRLLAHVLSDAFGSEPCTDLRSL